MYENQLSINELEEMVSKVMEQDGMLRMSIKNTGMLLCWDNAHQMLFIKYGQARIMDWYIPEGLPWSVAGPMHATIVEHAYRKVLDKQKAELKQLEGFEILK